jgi:hypothetical protein
MDIGVVGREKIVNVAVDHAQQGTVVSHNRPILNSDPPSGLVARGVLHGCGQ